MKVIELLNKIANGEEVPEKIKIENCLLEKFDYSIGDGTTIPSYSGREENRSINDVNLHDFLYSQYLNEEVEIIEEDKKIEKIKLNYNGTLGFPNGEWTARNMDKAFAIKINEIIEELNGRN